MTDARYPEAWLNDRRIVRLSDAAHRLFVTTLAWSSSNRTDGFIEAADLSLIHGVDARHHTELVAAGLWIEVPSGLQIVDFHKTQTTKAQLEGLDHKRHQDRERKARERARKRGVPDADPAEDGDLSRVTSDVTSRVTQRQGKDRQGKASTGSTDQQSDPRFWKPRDEMPADGELTVKLDHLPGRCPSCAFHVAKQGHGEGCPERQTG